MVGALSQDVSATGEELGRMTMRDPRLQQGRKRSFDQEGEREGDTPSKQPAKDPGTASYAAAAQASLPESTKSAAASTTPPNKKQKNGKDSHQGAPTGQSGQNTQGAQLKSSKSQSNDPEVLFSNHHTCMSILCSI